MLNRRHIRIKVLQALYAAIQSENTDIFNGQKQLMQKLDKVYDLTIYQLSMLLEVQDFAENRIEEAKKKNYPTQEELNPNTRFIDNSFLLQLKENINYNKKCEALAINWVNEPVMVRKIFLNLEESDFYKSYMDLSETPYKADKEFVQQFLMDVVIPHESLHSLFAEKNLHWADDYNLSAEVALMLISAYKIGWSEHKELPPLFKDDGGITQSQDRVFAKQLFKSVLENGEKYDELMKPKIKNWEMDRLATIDKILIQMALAEVIEMPTIPVKVSLNEYIELSKYFSTPKSKVFINGILDNVVADLKAKGTINKQGRGLVN